MDKNRETPVFAEVNKCEEAPLQEVSGRDVAALLNPRPVVLVGVYHKGQVNFSTVAWITPTSHDPAMLAFAVRESSCTLSLLKKTRRCSINVLDASLALPALWCGTHCGHSEDKGAQVPHTLAPLPATARSLPHVCGAPSVLDCQVNSLQQTGDHLLVVATVEHAYTRCTRDTRGRIAASDTLLCVQHDTFAQAKVLKGKDGAQIS
ncbi:MAG: flavin reductase family protein [Raoultibacter sp.]